MKKNNVVVLGTVIACLIALAIMPASLYAMPISAFRDAPAITPYGELLHSAVDPDGNMRFSWQDLAAGTFPFELYYRLDSSSWNLAEEGSVVNASALVPYQYGDLLRYRLSTKVELPDPIGEVAYIQAAYLDSSPARPELSFMARVADDPVGDSLMVYQPYYDLTDLQMAVSGDRLYTCLSNVSNTFPAMNTFSSYNVYGVLMGNESITSGAVYAMIYTFSVPGVISPGLYRIEIDIDMESTPTFERLGDIVSEVYQGKLYMSCSIADLAADDGLEGWPADSSSLLFMGAASLSLTVDFSTFEPEFAIGDLLNGGLIEFSDNVYYYMQNSLPLLSDARKEDLRLSLNYFDANGDYPLVMEYVFADGSSLAMEEGDMIGQNRRFTVQSPNNFAGGYINCSDNLIDYVTLEFDEVSAEDEQIPMAELKIIAPNPMRGGTMHKIEVKSQDNGLTELYLYDLRGRKIGKIHEGRAVNGTLSFDWDCRLDGRAIGSGVYFIRAEAGERSSLRRTTIIK